MSESEDELTTRKKVFGPKDENNYWSLDLIRWMMFVPEKKEKNQMPSKSKREKQGS